MPLFFEKDMEFYSRLTAYYDQIFPLAPEQVKFVRRHSPLRPEQTTLLDIGCATGSLAVALGRQGFRVWGLDSSAEMIRLAQEKAARAESAQDLSMSTAVFLTQDMRRLERAFPRTRFHALTCFGNTLVHLLSIDELQSFINQTVAILLPGGVFLLQILNYDLILDQRLTTLPLIENDVIRFERRYEFGQGRARLDFHSALCVKNTGVTMRNRIQLLALRRAQLHDLLAQAGYSGIRYYGDFFGREFDPRGLLLVAAARKSSREKIAL
jgi:glycine/sarcosine N-methyltransferase